MATKTTTYCDITNEICHQIFRIGISSGTEQYNMDLNENGLRLLVSELINETTPEIMNNILTKLINSRWQETLKQQS